MKARHPDELTLGLITRHSHGLADCVAELTQPIPTCGEWTMADLAWHMYEVQSFWVWVLRHRPSGPESYKVPIRPDDETPELYREMLRSVADDLVAELGAADAADAAWSWSDDHTVGFTIRRQIHEAAVHHVDGCLASDRPLPDITPHLAADGVDEMVDVMISGVPDWASFTGSGETVHLRCTDSGDSWTLALGTLSGTPPGSETSYDNLRGCRQVDDDAADLTIAGPALDLLLWLWGRGDASTLEMAGDPGPAHTLRATIVDATQ